MPVNIEIKGNLARLLATENLIVEHKQVETAQFDTKSRVLTLPMWNTVSNFVYDMLVAHEVGHALFTPCVMWKKDEYADVPKGYVNIIEDARIEKLMKNKFAGLNRDFYKGYEELNERDFFELEGFDVNQMKFIDKINLYFKLGAYLCLEFTDEENEFITETAKAETFEQVLDISKRVYEYSKQQAKKRKEQEELEQLSQGGLDEGGTQESEDGNDADLETPSYSESDEIDPDADLDDEDFDPFEADDEDMGGGQSAGNWNNMEESDTQEAFDRNSDKLQDKNSRPNTYVTIPELNLDNVVVPFDVLYNELKTHFDSEDQGTLDDDPRTQYYYVGNSIVQDKLEYREYKKSASKDVNNLVKEFEMKKSADSYARQSIAKTGVLDTSKLHTYMYNEDIFKKVTVIPEGKNHGLVFLLDWSGSMTHILKDTMKQLYSLVWFCRKVNIPFEVYAFSNDAWALGSDNTNTRELYHTTNLVDPDRLVKEMKAGDLHIEGSFRMVNVLSSIAKTKQLDEMMQLLWLQVCAFHGARYTYARKFGLSGTPLNEAIVAVGQLTKQLIKRSKLQKCHVITLTDGEGYHSSYNHMGTEYGTGLEKMRRHGVTPFSTIIRHKGSSFLNAINEPEFTCKLVEAVKSDIPNCNFIGIRILERNGLSQFYSWYGRKYYNCLDEMKSEMKRKGLVSFKTLAFDMWFAMNSKSLHVDDELEVDQGAEKRKITAAFRKMNRGKKSNKFMVKEFISQIA